MNDLTKDSLTRASNRLNVARLEQRILMSASPLVVLIQDVDISHGDRIPHAPLAGGEPDVTAPTTIGLGDYVDGEDANNAVILLGDFFSDDMDASLTYAIIHNTNPSLFDSANIVTNSAGGSLILDHAADAFGEANLTIRATDDAGNYIEDQLHVILLPVNDRPTTTGFTNIVVNEDSPATVIDLFDAFDDLEDADSDLTFSITQNTNPQLFSSIVIDAVQGTLTFHYAANAHGSSEITIRATDTEGQYVEMTTSGADFPIYDWLEGQPGVHNPDLELDEMGFVTNHWLFRYVNGQYQFDDLYEDQLRAYLRSAPAGVPLIFNIENSFYDNTPEGRDRFAEVFSIVHDERPDLEDFGVYRIMPERNFFTPMSWYRAQEDTARGFVSHYSNNYTQYQLSQAAWEARNDLFSNQPVSSQFGGTPLAEMVGMIYPSLYTSYRNDVGVLGPIAAEITIDVGHSTFAFADELAYDGMRVRLVRGNGASLPQGLVSFQEYYAVNVTDSSFQLAIEEGGTPVELQGSASGNFFLYISDQRYLLHDPAVRYWNSYAEGNIAEARQYNHTVIPWLSPSVSGVGQEYLDENFFRMQLDTMFELADGVGLYEAGTSAGALAENRGWWAALEGFMDYINSPTQFTITVNPVNDAPRWVGVADVLVDPGTAHSVVDLWQHFQDVDNTPTQLSLSIIGSTSPQAFDSLTIVDHTLHISHNVGRQGISFITVRATDPAGLTTEDRVFVQVGSIPVPENSLDEWAGAIVRLRAPLNQIEPTGFGQIAMPDDGIQASICANVHSLFGDNDSSTESGHFLADIHVDPSIATLTAVSTIAPFGTDQYPPLICEFRDHARRGWIADWHVRHTDGMELATIFARHVWEDEVESEHAIDMTDPELTTDLTAHALLPLRKEIDLTQYAINRRGLETKGNRSQFLAKH